MYSRLCIYFVDLIVFVLCASGSRWLQVRYKHSVTLHYSAVIVLLQKLLQLLFTDGVFIMYKAH